MLRFLCFANGAHLVDADEPAQFQIGAAHKQPRQALTASMLAALRVGERPTDVAAKFPFTKAYARKLARKNGIPEYPLQRYPKAHAELEAQTPHRRDAAKAIGGLDETEYVGGVLCYGLTHCGGEGNPDEQKRVITDRLVRWTTWDGRDSSQAQPPSAPSWTSTLTAGSRTGRTDPRAPAADPRGPATAAAPDAVRAACRAVVRPAGDRTGPQKQAGPRRCSSGIAASMTDGAASP